MKHQKPTPILYQIARFITGALFIFSGFIKANDPIGFAYKLEEYFIVFNLDFLQGISVGLSIALCGIEIILGAFLLLGLWKKLTTWGLLLLIIFFTFLTFYSAYFEAVKSCGCFGDAIPLSPWQSFYKDLILLLLIGYIFIARRHLTPLYTDHYTKNIVTAAVIIIALGIGIYTYNFLPFFDFLPYKNGNNIPELMEIPEGAQLDEYQTVYHLKHAETGAEKTLDDKAYVETGIWKDEAWVIVGEPESHLIKAGYQPPIFDLMISDSTGIDQTQALLQYPNYQLFVVAYDIQKASNRGLKEITALADTLEQRYNIPTYLLTSSSFSTASKRLDALGLDLKVLFADAVPLKSMVRSNPGLVLMKAGTVVKKWHHHLIPSLERFEKKYIDAD